MEQSANFASALKTSSERLADILCIARPSHPLDTEFLLHLGELILDHQDLTQLDLRSPLWDSQREDISSLIQSINRLQQLKNKYDSVLLPNAWDSDLGMERRAIAETKGKYFGSSLLRRLLSPEFRRAEQKLKSLWRGDLPNDLRQVGGSPRSSSPGPRSLGNGLFIGRGRQRDSRDSLGRSV